MTRARWLLAVGLVAVLGVVGLAGCSNAPTSAVAAPDAELSGVTQVNVSSQQEGIWVTGYGKVSAVPDMATLSLGIEAQDTTVASAQTRAAEAMDAVMAALRDGGVAAKDIQTRYFNIYRVTRWDRETEEEVVTGYRVSNMVSAKVRKVDQVGAIIDAAVRAGGDLTRVDGVAFSVDEPAPYLEEAREEAMADAKARAEQLAALAGVKLGRPTSISETGAYSPTPIYAPRVQFEMAEAAVGTSISAGETEISLTVQVIYAILD